METAAQHKVKATERGIWWIDDRGFWRKVTDARDELTMRPPFLLGSGRHGFAYKWLGMVWANMNQWKASFTWDVKSVSLESLEAVQEFLSDAPGGFQVRLRYFFGGWSSEEFDDPREAAKRLDDIMGYRAVEPMGTLLIQRQPIAEVGRSGTLLQWAYRLCERTGGVLDLADDPEIRAILPFVQVLMHKNADAGLCYDSIGHNSLAAKVFGPGWANFAQSKSYRLNPIEERHARRIYGSYDEVFENGEPQLHHVRFLYDGFDRDPEWISFERLLFRAVYPSGEPVLVVVCDRRNDIFGLVVT